MLGRDKHWLAQQALLARKTVDHFLEGATVWPTHRTLRKVAKALGVSVAWLTADAPDHRLTERERQELLQLVRDLRGLTEGVRRTTQTIDPRTRANVRRETRLRVPRQFRALGARQVYRARGESLNGLGIRNGDLVYVRPLTRANARSAVGDIVLVQLNGSLLLRRFTVEKRSVDRRSGEPLVDLFGERPRAGEVVVPVLRSAHPAHPAITISAADDCKPLGHVVAIVRQFVA